MRVLLTSISRIAGTRKNPILEQYPLSEYGLTDDHRTAYNTLIQAFEERIQLNFQDPRQVTCVLTDSSKYAWCFFIAQTPVLIPGKPLQDHPWEPLCFCDGAFNEKQFLMSIVEKEAFAIMMVLKKADHFLHNTWVLFTDNEILSYLYDTSTLNIRTASAERLLRVGNALQCHQVDVYHINSEQNPVADYGTRALSTTAAKQHIAYSSMYYMDGIMDDTTKARTSIFSFSINNIERSHLEHIINIDNINVTEDYDNQYIIPVTRSQTKANRLQTSNNFNPDHSSNTDHIPNPDLNSNPDPMPLPSVDDNTDNSPNTDIAPESVNDTNNTSTHVYDSSDQDLDKSPSIEESAIPISQQEGRTTLPDSPPFKFIDEEQVVKIPLLPEIILAQRQALEDEIPNNDTLYHESAKNINGIVTVIYNGKRVYWIPLSSLTLRIRFLNASHENLGGHFDIKETTRKIIEYVAWTTCKTDIARWVEHCLHCRRNKGGIKSNRPFGKQYHGEFPNDVLFLDFLFIGESKKTKHKWVLIIKDSFSGFIRIFPCNTPDSYSASFGLYNWFCDYDMWNMLFTDNGSHFKNELIDTFNKMISSKHQFNVPYTSHSAGGIESVHPHFLTVLRCLMGENMSPFEDWPDYCKTIEKILNERPDKDRGNYSHKQIFLGIKAKSSVKLVLQHLEFNVMNKIERIGRIKNVDTHLTDNSLYQQHIALLEEELSEIRAICKSAWLKRRQARIARSLRVHGAEPANFELCDLILVAHIDKDHKLNKLQAQWKGPFKITRIINSFVYEVEYLRNFPHPGNRSIHHAIRLRFFSHSNEVDINEDLKRNIEYSISMFQVSTILKYRIIQPTNEVQVLVKWLGLTNTENTWHALKLIYSKAPLEVESFLKTLSFDLQSQLRKSIS